MSQYSKNPHIYSVLPYMLTISSTAHVLIIVIGITGPMVTSVEDIYRVFNKPRWLPGYEEDKT